MRSLPSTGRGWLKSGSDVITIVMAIGLEGWMLFDLYTGRRQLGFVDWFSLFVIPLMLWRLIPRAVGQWRARKDDV